MQPGLSLDDIIARKRAQVKAKKNGKVVAPIEDEKEVNEDDESGTHKIASLPVGSIRKSNLDL